MKNEFQYLLIDVCCIAVPLLASFHPAIGFYKHWKKTVPVTLITALIFIAWDVLFTAHGVWHFNEKYITGIQVLNLPLEEVLFFLCIPYSCLFVFFCVSSIFNFSTGTRIANAVTWTLAVTLIVVAAICYKNLYTSITFSLLGISLLVFGVRKSKFMGYFYASFLLTLIPFVISNGILTGSFGNDPIVLYNSQFNLGVRILNIPIEDIFYGMLFQLMNAGGFIMLSTRKRLLKHR